MKKLVVGVVFLILLIPCFKIHYYNGETIETKRSSVLGIIIQDIKDGTLGTSL